VPSDRLTDVIAVAELPSSTIGRKSICCRFYHGFRIITIVYDNTIVMEKKGSKRVAKG
jgi:hypothetical protein